MSISLPAHPGCDECGGRGQTVKAGCTAACMTCHGKNCLSVARLALAARDRFERGAVDAKVTAEASITARRVAFLNGC